jgi:hypothetical protein
VNKSNPSPHGAGLLKRSLCGIGATEGQRRGKCRSDDAGGTSKASTGSKFTY